MLELDHPHAKIQSNHARNRCMRHSEADVVDCARTTQCPPAAGLWPAALASRTVQPTVYSLPSTAELLRDLRSVHSETYVGELRWRQCSNACVTRNALIGIQDFANDNGGAFAHDTSGAVD